LNGYGKRVEAAAKISHRTGNDDLVNHS
jgi:hypothetical protein